MIFKGLRRAPECTSSQRPRETARSHSQAWRPLWICGSLCIDPNTGVVCGEPERITNDLADEYDPTLSRDGSKLLFTSDRGRNRDVYIPDMATGQDRRLTFTDHDEDTAVVLSPDGMQAIYRDRVGSDREKHFDSN